jgi:hypothetical protein
VANVIIRRSAILLAVLGVLLIALSGTVRFVIVPLATKLPADTDMTVHYAGTASMLNQTALQAGDTAHAMSTNLPVNVERHLQVTAVHGNTAVLDDAIVLNVAGQKQTSAHVYAIDRTEMTGVSSPAGTVVEPSTGALSSTFPLNGKQDDSYRMYDSTTRMIVPLKFTGESELNGRMVNNYRMSVTGAVKDPALLKALPPALPKTLMASLAPLLPKAVQAQMTPAVVTSLPEVIPMAYTGVSTIVVAVDRQTGAPLGQTISQQVIAGVTLGQTTMSLLPVSSVEFKITKASADELLSQAVSGGRLLNLLAIAAPLVLLIGGLLLMLIAIARRHRPASIPAPVLEHIIRTEEGVGR